MKKTLILLLLSFCFFSSNFFAQYNSLSKTHSHNDYERRVPLIEALNNNFVSIEADIHLANDKLYVAHTKAEIDTSRTLANTYLEPLFKIYEQRGNKIYDNSSLILLIDIKTNANKTYNVLINELNKYKSMLTIYYTNSLKRGAIDIIISGNRPIKQMRNEKVRLAALDGRPKNVYENESSTLFPLISENWGKILSRYPLKVNNLGDKTLINFIKDIHSQNKLVRFWATEDNVESWKLLLKLNVDLISTDSPSKLNRFLKKLEK